MSDTILEGKSEYFVRQILELYEIKNLMQNFAKKNLKEIILQLTANIDSPVGQRLVNLRIISYKILTKRPDT